jgi:type IV fimbrial biogenesis protein FimT
MPALHHRPRTSLGFTLLELLLAMALAALLAALALPSFGSAVTRQRLKGSAQALAQGMAEARHEALQRGRPLHLSVRGGRDWCWAITDTPDQDCRQPLRRAWRQQRADDAPGVHIARATGASFGPHDGLALGPGEAVFETTLGEQVRVRLSPLGRTSLCSPNGAPGFVTCVN